MAWYGTTIKKHPQKHPPKKTTIKKHQSTNKASANNHSMVRQVARTYISKPMEKPETADAHTDYCCVSIAV